MSGAKSSFPPAATAMKEPYLMYGLCFPANTSDAQQQQVIDDVLLLLPPAPPPTPLTVPCTYVVPVPAAKAYKLWETISARLANHWDPQFNGDLQWYVHLADRNGCELSYN